jgi:hypothetical protein
LNYVPIVRITPFTHDLSVKRDTKHSPEPQLRLSGGAAREQYL